MGDIYARQSVGQVRSPAVGKETLQEALVRLGWANENIITINDADVTGQQSCNERVDMHRLYQLMQQRKLAEKAQYN